jgi:hypothetical protein
LNELKKLGAIAFAMFVFAGSVNIIINQHLCDGELESSALFVTATPCEHATAQNDLPPCHKTSNAKGCCAVNQVVIGSLVWFNMQNITGVKVVPQDTPALLYFENSLEYDSFLTSIYSPEKVPKPPDDYDSVYIRHQAFLL